MSVDIPYINDRRGILFTINSESDPVYQVNSNAWAHSLNRWSQDDIPLEIREKVADLLESGKPGVFLRFHEGDDGIYLICEKNIRNLPDAADEEIVLGPRLQPGRDRELAPYDIVLYTKAGTIQTDDGQTVATQDGEYYVVKCQSWGRFILNQPVRPAFVETTKDFLLLLDDLHGRNFLSMSPDGIGEILPNNMPEPTGAPYGLNCYVLNLARFKR